MTRVLISASRAFSRQQGLALASSSKLNTARICLLALVFIVAFQAQAQTYPNYTSVFVNDFAEIIDPATEDRIAMTLVEAREERGLEMTVVTIESRADYGFDNEIEPFATGLFNEWGVGDPERNDGIMLLVSVEDRDMRIELGAGYPKAYDYLAQKIIDQNIIPHFKNGNFALGIESGVDEVLVKIDINAAPEVQKFSDSGKRLRTSPAKRNDTDGFVTWVLGILAAIGAVLGGLSINRRRPRRCAVCNNNMKRLSEKDDDAFLDRGQKVEESVRSKDYDVWYCARDDFSVIKGYRAWFSKHSLCRSCSYRTLHSQRRVLHHATTSSEGRALVQYKCKHCKDKWSEYVTIPRRSESSSSSSSSSFSGGSSSGGGASGRW